MQRRASVPADTLDGGRAQRCTAYGAGDRARDARVSRPNVRELNLYVYSDDDPINRVDPPGLTSGPQTPGCDYVGRLPIFDTRECCNIHDQCYVDAFEWCSKLSWLDYITIGSNKHWECMRCNNQVVGCLSWTILTRRKGCSS